MKAFLLFAVMVIQIWMPFGHGRTGERIKPNFITIHATDNRSAGADALRHALALRHGIRTKGTFVSWHYTVDSRRVVQNLRETERGVHAGPGNRQSIGIEICLNRDGNLPRAINHAAWLTAQVMKRHGIPITRVVPHWFWTRKPCPSIMMDRGRPGEKWTAFQKLVLSYL